MDSIAYYNGNFGRRQELKIPLSDRALFFGDGIYDAAIAVSGKIVWENEHIDRFFDNATALGLCHDLTKEKLKLLLRETVKKSNFENGFLYFQMSRNSEKRIHSAKGLKKSNLLITVEKFTFSSPEKQLSLITFPDERYGYCNIKTLNLLPSVLAATDAENKECDEAVFIREGCVTECSHSNIFIVKDDTVITHPKSKHILPGIAREKIIAACHNLKIPVLEEPFTQEDLLSADEILISSTTKLCLGVNMVDGIAVGGKNAELRRKIYGELHKDLVKFSNI